MVRMLTRAAVAALLVLAAPGVMAQVVISQVYGGAGCGTAGCSTYKNDYIELFNRGTSSASVNGWSVQYAAATGTSWQVTNLPNVSIPAGGYLLVSEGAGPNGVNNLPTPDVTGTIAMSATTGKVALVNATGALSGACPTGASIQDFVGYGTTANCNEGGANTPAPSTTNAVFRALGGCTDSGSNSADFAAAAPNPRTSSSSTNSCSGGPVTPNLSINDVTLAEGNAGTTTFSFTVSLSSPAGAGGVTFDIATADGTATTADNDYVSKSLTSQTISAGNSSYTFDVSVNGDTTTEANQTFFVNVTNATGATVTDGQGQGTINNDDITITPIHDVQGPGASSPIVGSNVHVRGIVTARTGSGFFVQEEAADVDADPATSEGIFVFTSSTPPATAAVGNNVTVNGTVAEFVPSATPWNAPVTELTSPTVTQNSTGNALPGAIDLNADLAFASYTVDTFERYEGMRVSVSDLDVVAPSDGSINESSGVVTSDHTFFGVIGGVARPFREPGLAVAEVPFYPGYAGPVFDQNMERIRVRGQGQSGSSLVFNVAVGDGITGLVGVMDVFSGNYTILPDPGSSPVIVPGSNPSFARLPAADEITVSGANLLRFYDNINDGAGPNNGDVANVTLTTYNNRIAKAARVVCQAMNAPDIIGTVEVEKKAVLDALAAAIDDTANSGCATAPHYVAYLTEGNDPGGIDAGFLVKTAEVSAGVPRVTVNAVTQQGLCTLFKDASGNDVTTGGPAYNNGCVQQGTFLNDRPPLFLDATVHAANGAAEDITVVANHMRSLNNANTFGAGSNGYTTDGARVRAKRHQQAVELANMIQARQVADAGERIILVGDFNVFEFNDGLGDSLGTIMGTPAADSATVVPNDGADLVDPNLTSLASLNPPAERYSYSFDGNAQSLDHAIANQAVLTDFTVDEDHARINADFPQVDYGDFSAGSVLRISDHDPVVVYLGATSFSTADLYTSVSAIASPINLGQQAQFQVIAGSYGPDSGQGLKLDFSIAVAPARVSVSPGLGWTCGTPQTDGSGGTIVHCNRATIAVEASSFQVNVNTTTGDSFSSLTLGAAITGATTDPDHSNDSASATVLFNVTTDLQLVIAPPTGRLSATVPVAFKATIVNAGNVSASAPTFDFTLNAPSSAVTSISSQYGYFTGCTAQSSTPTSSTWHCPGSTLPRAKKDVVSVNVIMPAGWTGTAMTMSGTVGSSTLDSKPSNNSASASAPVPRR
ncbi:lamin tail domain-containing protein [Arenimonas sp.]|uniref:lamin tail domain-containing protein n=1 Tax=Arenimonas sp. TaxID=1872635 RepID=UPI0039E269D1